MECISLSSEYVISFGRGRILLALNMGLVWASAQDITRPGTITI
jgi:hypothetical protein